MVTGHLPLAAFMSLNWEKMVGLQRAGAVELKERAEAVHAALSQHALWKETGRFDVSSTYLRRLTTCWPPEAFLLNASRQLAA